MPTLKDLIKQVVREEMLSLGESLRPGGDHSLRGFDPDYQTFAWRLNTELDNDEVNDDSYEQGQAPVSEGESIAFELEFLLKNVGTDKAIGVVVQVPGTPTEGSFTIDGGSPHAVADFNEPVGSLIDGHHTVKGEFKSAASGMLKIALGAPTAEESEENAITLFEDDTTSFATPMSLALTAPVAAGVKTYWLISVYVEIANMTQEVVGFSDDHPFVVVEFSGLNIGYVDSRFVETDGVYKFTSTVVEEMTGPSGTLEVDIDDGGNGGFGAATLLALTKAVRLTGPPGAGSLTPSTSAQIAPGSKLKIHRTGVDSA